MKQLYLVLLYVFPVVSCAQSLSFSKTHYGAFIGLDNPAGSNPKEYFLPTNNIVLLEKSMNKAIEWARLNATHKMVFKKEITRFKVMRKDQMMRYHEFLPQYALDTYVLFDGLANGEFVCTVTFEKGSTVEFRDEKSINSFIDLLNSKLTNATVDNVFH